MALTSDQRALLRLLLAGDDYEQVAEVLGASRAEIRERAHAAAASLEREGDPELPTDVVTSRLRQLEGGASPQPATARPGTGARPALSRRFLWAVGAGAIAVLALVLALTVLGGDDDDGTAAPPVDREEAVTIDLAPVGGSRASGTLTIIRLADQPALDLAIRGLEPSGPDQSYVLWFVGSGARSLPVAFQPVGADGEISGRTPIPGAAVGLLPNFDTAELTLAAKRDAAAAIREGGQTGALPERVGKVVLRGSLRP